MSNLAIFLREQADRLRGALVFTGSAQVDAYLDVFLTDDRTPRDSVLTKKFHGDNAAIAALFEAESLRVERLVERRRALTIRDRTEALLQIATVAAANYDREKQELTRSVKRARLGRPVRASCSASCSRRSSDCLRSEMSLCKPTRR